MIDEVWGAAASRSSEARPTGLKKLLMEEVVSSLQVLNAAPYELLEAEHEALAQAMTRVLGWLHRQIATPPLRIKTPYQLIEEEEKMMELSALKELTQVFQHWHKLQQSMENSMNRRFWMLWVELGCTLDVLRYCEVAEKKTENCMQLVMTSRPPNDFPTSGMHCNKEKQVTFSREMWDAVLAKPLYGATEHVVADVALRLVELFLCWMAAAMRGYEMVFIANVATPLRKHLYNSSASNPLLEDVWLKFANFKMGAANITKNAAGVAVTVMVLSSLTSSRRSSEVGGYLEVLTAATVDELSRGLFPQPHHPVAIVAIALGLTSLDDARPSNNLSAQLQSGNATLLCQFALLRLASLRLLSSRLKPYDDATIADYQLVVHGKLKTLIYEPSQGALREYSLQMTEACIEEMVGYFQTSLGTYLSLVEAVQSVLPEELFRLEFLNQLRESSKFPAQDKSMLTSAPEIVAFLKQFYGAVAPLLEALSTCHLVRAFLALSRIEFAREICATPTANASMQAVTQRLDNALDNSATPPSAIFAPVLRSVAMHSMAANADIPPEVNVTAGCQALAVGLVMQRNLRILLFQCTQLVDDALAVVFLGLYNVFEPVDAFAHRFLGVCLSRFGKFIPLFTVYPQYLQATLAAYPTNASPQDLTKACGAIFGSLFYSEVLTMPSGQDNEITETTQRMGLWAIRKCCERSTELLAEQDKEAALSTKSTKDKAGEKQPAKEAAAVPGLYVAGLVFELMKMAPINILKASAMEAESLLARWKNNPRVLRALKSVLFARISQNCEAEKRAWLAAWYIEVDNHYPVDSSVATSRL